MQQNPKKINKKIKAISKIAKITNAMKIIAAMKIKKLSSNIHKNQEILKHLKTCLQILQKIYWIEHPELVKKPSTTSNQTLWIIYTSDLGLCGNYNTQIIQKLKSHSKTNDIYFIVGKKGINHFEFQNFSLGWKSNSQDFDLNKTKELVSKILKGYKTLWNRVMIIFSQSSNPLKVETMIENLLPINVSKEISSKPIENKFIVEPDIDTVFQNSQKVYLEIYLYNLFFQSRIAEETSRRLAMENASDNADDMVFDLKLKYNQKRQENITQEILEVSQD